MLTPGSDPATCADFQVSTSNLRFHSSVFFLFYWGAIHLMPFRSLKDMLMWCHCPAGLSDLPSSFFSSLSLSLATQKGLRKDKHVGSLPNTPEQACPSSALVRWGHREPIWNDSIAERALA